jgi:ABC-type antimicrobial peptide transport system permease subunit
VTLIGSIVIIFQSTSQVVLERKKEFGVMKAVGFRNVDIKKEIRAEIFFQILIGFIIGLVLSYVLISLLAQTKISINIPWELNPYPHFLSSDPASVKTVQDYSLPIAFNRALILISFMIVFSVGFLTSEIILNRINKIKAMEILRYE